jgi:hypothetical protein
MEVLLGQQPVGQVTLTLQQGWPRPPQQVPEPLLLPTWQWPLASQQVQSVPLSTITQAPVLVSQQSPADAQVTQALPTSVMHGAVQTQRVPSPLSWLPLGHRHWPFWQIAPNTVVQSTHAPPPEPQTLLVVLPSRQMPPLSQQPC